MVDFGQGKFPSWICDGAGNLQNLSPLKQK